MKKILILADGILAKYFLERVINLQDGENNYSVVYYQKKSVPEHMPENFKYHYFDPTSFKKLSSIFDVDFFQVMIVVSKKIDAVEAYQNIRKIDSQIQIVMVDRWGIKYDDKRLYLLDSREVLSSRFADYLPDMPVIAQNVGLGQGEIMEVRIPTGSSYSYRHLGSIEQSKWKIAAIYRANALILPRDSLMIQPNDVLLIIGNPNVLKSVYKSAKREIGQFPSPFGQIIYCLIDMLSMREKDIETILNDAMLLHSKINSRRLYIKVINPTYSKQFEKIKSYEGKYISVNIDYYENSLQKTLKTDAKNLDIGLIVVRHDFFVKYIKDLFEIRKPIFKIGFWGFSEVKEAVILSNNSEDIEKESSAIFDFSSQLDLKIKLYNFRPEETSTDEELSEHFNNLSKIFNKEIEIIDSKKNPLLVLRNKNNILQFVPFSKKVSSSNIFSIFSTDMEKLYFKLASNYQVFIPVTVDS
ncbi:MAG: TrkA C-terminal domain-containing protein [Sulfurospirillaceae bacterium]|nr:TrkA C-terminal domain-containing protein [Sulfurospirillaceae bacterium]